MIKNWNINVLEQILLQKIIQYHKYILTIIRKLRDVSQMLQYRGNFLFQSIKILFKKMKISY